MVRRVVLVSMFREKCGGGAGMVAYELARHLAPRCRVLVLCPGDRTEVQDCPDGPAVLSVASAGTDDLCFPSLDRRSVSQAFALLDRFAPDIVHSHDAVSVGGLAQAWALSRGVPFAMTLHVQADRSLEFGAAERARFLMRLVGEPLTRSYLRCFYGNCSALFAPNQSAAQSLERLGVAGRVFVVPNGRDLDRFRRCRAAEPGGPGRQLCFVGYLSERKNQAFLVETMAHLPRDYRLCLVGKPLSRDYETRLREQADCVAPGRVEFTGSVEYEAIPPLLEQAHVFVSASKLEVQCLAVIESLASGTPVVGLANETVDELVDGAVGRRLDRDATPAEFARRVREVCELPVDEYGALCRNARERVRDHDWASVTARTVAVYESVLAGHRPRPAEVPAPGLGRLVRRRSRQEAATRFYSDLNSGLCSALWLLSRGRAATRRRHAAPRP